MLGKVGSKGFTAAGIGLLLIMSFLLYWVLQEVSTNYRRMELSNKLLSHLLGHQTTLAREYEYKSRMLSQKLDQAQVLITQYREENLQLQQKVQLLDQLDDLQNTILQLKEENDLVREQLEEMKKGPAVGKLKSFKEGKSLVAEYRKRIKEVGRQVHLLKKDMYQQRVSDLKEVDRIESMLGNKGYLVRDGQAYSQSVVFPIDQRNVNIDVKFVP